MQGTLQHLLRQLSALRAELAHARTVDEVLGALGAGLVPSWADGLRIVVRGSEEPIVSVGSPNGEYRSDRIPFGACDEASPSTIWLCAEPAEPTGWTPIDVVADDADLPAANHVILLIDGFGEPAAVLLDRAPDRGAWTAADLSVVSESVRLVEFALRTLQQHRRTLEARAAADAAAHRWSAFARMSQRLVRSVDFDEVSTAIVGAVVPYLADWAFLDIITPHAEVERIRRSHAMPERQRLLETITAFPFGSEEPMTAIAKLDDEGWLSPSLEKHDLRRLAGPGEQVVLEELAPQSVAVVPLAVGGQIRGVLTLATTAAGQKYQPEDLALFGSLAHQATLALTSAQLYGAARRARMEREEVLAIVSHDLKNPLNTLGFALTILGQEGMAEEAKSQQYGIMERALAQMDALVRDLLDTARIDAGRFSVSPSPQDAAELIREAMLRSEPQAEQAQVRLEHADLQNLPPVLADRHRIMQVFANLIDNAISFSPAHGRVHVSASAGERDVVFSISDSGPGLDAETAEHVFDRFWQARNAGRAGAGLGLAIAHGIVRAHGGEIGVRSAAGQGATFHFSIPRARV